MQMKAILVEKTSKSGNPYVAIEVYITDTIKKLVFLTQAELELIRMRSNNANK